MTSPGISIALPVHRADPGALRTALGCIRGQTLRDLDIILILNGADEPTSRLARQLASSEPRARVLQLPGPNLAAALNLALSQARFDLVARMDADDECPPDRLALQAEFLRAHPCVAAAGTAFEGFDDAGNTIGINRPPTDPADIRWRLLLGNLFCHGSMMLRRGMVLSAGGYNPECRYAQDYELWLRLSRDHDLANLPRVLYRYRADHARRHVEQAVFASTAMLEAWSDLPPLAEGDRARVVALLAHATWGGERARESLGGMESLLRARGPSREAIQAWQWIAQRAGRCWNSLADLHRLDRVRAAGRRLAAAGVREVWLYGAGRHTAWLLENLDALGVPVAGIADDRLAGGHRCGRDIASPGEIPTGAHVLLSSDAHEPELRRAAAPLEPRGVTVWPIYSADPAPEPGAETRIGAAG